MADREKVIKGLHQHCEGSMFDRCGECSYYEVADEPFQCRDALLMDVFDLLKEQEEQIDTQRKNLMILLNEQEAVDPTINEYGEVFCGNCGENVGIVGQTIKTVVRMRYCPECGKAVKWE